MTAKKHPAKHDDSVEETPEVKSAPEGDAPVEKSIEPLPADANAVVEAVPRPTAVGGKGTVVAPPAPDDIAGVLQQAFAHPGPVSILVRNESDRALVQKLCAGGKQSRVVRIKPDQDIRIMWRAVSPG